MHNCPFPMWYVLLLMSDLRKPGPWPMAHAPCPMPLVPCPLPHGACPMSHGAWRMAHVRCTMAHVRCTMAHVRCTMSHVRCTMSHVRCTMSCVQWSVRCAPLHVVSFAIMFVLYLDCRQHTSVLHPTASQPLYMPCLYFLWTYNPCGPMIPMGL